MLFKNSISGTFVDFSMLYGNDKAEIKAKCICCSQYEFRQKIKMMLENTAEAFLKF